VALASQAFQAWQASLAGMASQAFLLLLVSRSGEELQSGLGQLHLEARKGLGLRLVLFLLQSTSQVAAQA